MKGTEKPIRLALVIATIVLGVGCSSRGPSPSSPFATAEARPTEEYRLQSGDSLDVAFRYKPELDETVVVRPDGDISLQLVGDIEVAGKTAEGLRSDIWQRYADILQNPEVSVLVRSLVQQGLYVGGEVAMPGLVEFRHPTTVLEAITVAGGLKLSARSSRILVINDDGTERVAVSVVDLDDYRGDSAAAPLFLQPYDVVYVPKSAAARVGDFVELYINRVIPRSAQRIISIIFLYGFL